MRATASIGGHPLRLMIVHFPMAFLMRALLFDVAAAVGLVVPSIVAGYQSRRSSSTACSAAPPRIADRQIVQHVVNHASYYRGQVTTMLRQLGANPPKAMDLIAFYRERAMVM